jgi:hypothetical protein
MDDMARTDLTLWERLRRFWLPGHEIDHPLTDAERESALPVTAVGEVASLVNGALGAEGDERE